MKARVKKSTEIIDVGYKQYSLGHRRIWGYEDEEGVMWTEDELEILNHEPDYWTRLEHTYAGMAMQGILSNPESELDYKDDETFPQALAGCAAKIAHALVEKMKNKEERK